MVVGCLVNTDVLWTYSMYELFSPYRMQRQYLHKMLLLPVRMTCKISRLSVCPIHGYCVNLHHHHVLNTFEKLSQTITFFNNFYSYLHVPCLKGNYWLQRFVLEIRKQYASYCPLCTLYFEICLDDGLNQIHFYDLGKCVKFHPVLLLT